MAAVRRRGETGRAGPPRADEEASRKHPGTELLPSIAAGQVAVDP
jgi:hypothetical protein